MAEQRQPIQTVVEGEASESDEDEEVAGIMDGGNKKPQGVVVSGEASESDEEEINNEDTDKDGIMPLTLAVDLTNKGDSADPTSSVPLSPGLHKFTERDIPKYDTLFHKKLREKNISLRKSITELIQQSYANAAKNIKETTQQMLKSQSAIQDVSHNLRLLTNDLFHLEDKIDIVTSCGLLPDIQVPVLSSPKQTAPTVTE